MGEKALNQHGRWRNKMMAFRVSPEEDAHINALVAMSGLSKQDYIARRLMDEEVVVTLGSRVQLALQREAVAVYRELRCIRESSEISPELAARNRAVVDTFAALDVEAVGSSSIEAEDALVGGAVRKADEKGDDAR